MEENKIVQLDTKNTMSITDVARNLADYRLDSYHLNEPVVTSEGSMIFVSKGKMDLHGGTPYFTVLRIGESQRFFAADRVYMNQAEFDDSVKRFIEDFC